MEDFDHLSDFDDGTALNPFAVREDDQSVEAEPDLCIIASAAQEYDRLYGDPPF